MVAGDERDSRASRLGAWDDTIRPPRVLIVEDSENDRGKYVDRLEAAGYATTTAASLREATLLLIQSELVFDVAVLDMRLPDGCGADLVHPLLKREPLCRAVVVTGNEDPSPLELAEIGANAWVNKPANPRRFLLAVEDTFQATRAWREVSGQCAQELRPGPTSYADGAVRADSEEGLLAFDIRRAAKRLAEIGGLTPAQTLTAYRILWGDSDKQIAAFLNIAMPTVRHHVDAVIRKTGAGRRSALLRVLLRDAGIPDPGALS